MELDFVDNSDNVGVSTVREVEVSVHQGPVEVTSAILVLEQAPTMNTMVPAPQCATVLTCVPLLLQGLTVSVPLLVPECRCNSTMLVQGTVLPPGTRAPITMQWQAFLPMASLIPGSAGGTSAHEEHQSATAERRYAANGRYAVAQSGFQFRQIKETFGQFLTGLSRFLLK